MPIDSAVQRKVMGRFATGVTVVTTGGNGKPTGLTATAICSLSLDPPLVLVAVAKRAASYAELAANRCYAINILAQGHEEVSRRFATPGPKDFSGWNWKTAATGAPILDDALGYLDCKVVEILPGGDHDIFIGEVVAGDAREDAAPLLYYHGKYRALADAS